MTIIELNIAGLHVTGSAPSRRAIKRTWQRNVRAVSRNLKSAHWPAVQLRPRHASDRSAA